VSSHSRFACPTPRNASTGLKIGPCDYDTTDFSGPTMVVAPGPITIIFEESIPHIGAPWRISLSGQNDDYSVLCTLLDHIPHNDKSAPNYYDPTTYTKYYITVTIPDIACDKCALHLSNPMTDKLTPKGSYCTDPGTCFSVYHSCANLIITGTEKNFTNIKCPNLEQWPLHNLQPNNYTQENATWEKGLLVGFPEEFTTLVGPCLATTSSSGMSSGKKAAIAIPIVLVAVLALIGFCYWRKKAKPDYVDLK